jgi:heme exporter protein D
LLLFTLSAKSCAAFSSFWVWLGFGVTSTSMDVIWMGKSSKLWMFEIFSSLLCFLAMGAIIAGWRM